MSAQPQLRGKGVTCKVASIPKVPIRDEGAYLAHFSEPSLLEAHLSCRNSDKVDEGDSGSEQDRQASSRAGQRPQSSQLALGIKQHQKCDVTDIPSMRAHLIGWYQP